MQISIIVPAYNVEPYIEQCLDSILKTPIDEYEVIVVDDGSSDGTKEILERYQSLYKEIRVIMQSNSGAAAARNKGLDNATGEYIGFVDADDWVEPTMFSEMYYTAKQFDADIVFCNILKNEDEKLTRYIPTGIYDRNGIKETIFPSLISNTDIKSGRSVLRGSVWSKIFRKSILTQHFIRFDEDLVYNEDSLFAIQATLYANRYYYAGDSYLYHNRYVANSITKRYIDNLWERQKKLKEKLTIIAKGADYDFSEQINKKIFEVAVYCVENIYKQVSPLSYRNKRRETGRIVSDSIVQDCLRKLHPEKMKRIEQGYYYAFRYRLLTIIPLICRYRTKR